MKVVGPPTTGPPKVAKAERRPPRVRVHKSAVRLRGTVIELPITCPRRERTGAAATVTLVMRTPAPGGRRRRSRRARIATQTVDLGAGERKVVRLKLRRRHRMMVRRARRARLTAEITAVDHTGRTGRQSASLSL